MIVLLYFGRRGQQKSREFKLNRKQRANMMVTGGIPSALFDIQILCCDEEIKCDFIILAVIPFQWNVKINSFIKRKENKHKWLACTASKSFISR